MQVCNKLGGASDLGLILPLRIRQLLLFIAGCSIQLDSVKSAELQKSDHVLLSERPFFFGTKCMMLCAPGSSGYLPHFNQKFL